MPRLSLPGLPPVMLATHSGRDIFVSRALEATGSWEPLETRVVREILRPGDTFVDLGANIGYYSVVAALSVGPTGRVFAFEPEPENVELARRNATTAGLTQVVVETLAVGDTTGAGELFCSEHNRGDNRAFPTLDGRRSMPVGVTSLDDYFAGRNFTLRLVKMDTQGSEARILRGMRGLLSQPGRVEAIVLEFWPFGLSLAGDRAEDVIALLEELDPLFGIVDEARNMVQAVSAAELRSMVAGSLNPSTRRFANLLVVPRQRQT